MDTDDADDEVYDEDDDGLGESELDEEDLMQDIADSGELSEIDADKESNVEEESNSEVGTTEDESHAGEKRKRKPDALDTPLRKNVMTKIIQVVCQIVICSSR